MGVRTNVVFGELGREHDLIWFFRHWDGYPDGPVARDLEQMARWIREGRIRADPQHASGWLLVLGMKNKPSSTLLEPAPVLPDSDFSRRAQAGRRKPVRRRLGAQLRLEGRGIRADERDSP